MHLSCVSQERMRAELCSQREQAESQLRAECEELRMQSRRVQQQLQEELAKLQQHCTESLLQAESHKQQVCVFICVSEEHSQNLLTTSFQSDQKACLLPYTALNHLQSEHGADGIIVSWFYTLTVLDWQVLSEKEAEKATLNERIITLKRDIETAALEKDRMRRDFLSKQEQDKV